MVLSNLPQKGTVAWTLILWISHVPHAIKDMKLIWIGNSRGSCISMRWLSVLISQYLESCAARALWTAKNKTISWTDWSYSDGEKLSWNESLEKGTGWMEWMLELSTGAFRGRYLPYSMNLLLIFMVFTAAPFPIGCGKLRASSLLWSQRVWVEGGPGTKSYPSVLIANC